MRESGPRPILALIKKIILRIGYFHGYFRTGYCIPIIPLVLSTELLVLTEE